MPKWKGPFNGVSAKLKASREPALRDLNDGIPFWFTNMNRRVCVDRFYSQRFLFAAVG